MSHLRISDPFGLLGAKPNDFDFQVTCHDEEVISTLSEKSGRKNSKRSPEAKKGSNYLRNMVGGRRRVQPVRNVVKSQTNSKGGFQNLAVECFKAADDPMLCQQRREIWHPKKKRDSSIALVAIEATQICSYDVSIRRGQTDENVSQPFIMGTNFVGIVQDGSIAKGTRVAGLTTKGSNARFIEIGRDELVKVPAKLDAPEVACVMATYLPAFQALQYGRGDHVSRHCTSSFVGKNILITKGSSPETLSALVQLALSMEAENVYVLCHASKHRFIRDIDAIPLYMDKWLEVVEGTIDVVLDYDCGSRNEFDNHCCALRPSGRLVSVVPPQKSSIFGGIETLMRQTSLCFIDRAFLFDPKGRYPHIDKKDARFLLELLVTSKIRPLVDCFIALDGIDQAHVDIQAGNVNGAIVCEPWKEF